MMAAVHYTAASSRLRHSRSTTTTTTFAISTSFPRQRALRKNHLRHKILKTLRHPSIPIDTGPLQLVIEPALKEIQEFDDSQNQQIQEVEVVKEVGISEPTIGVITVDGNVGLLDKNPILKYGLWLAGAFVFQAVCAVWVFGSDDSGSRNGDLNGSEKDPILGSNGNVNWQLGIEKDNVKNRLKTLKKMTIVMEVFKRGNEFGWNDITKTFDAPEEICDALIMVYLDGKLIRNIAIPSFPMLRELFEIDRAAGKKKGAKTGKEKIHRWAREGRESSGRESSRIEDIDQFVAEQEIHLKSLDDFRGGELSANLYFSFIIHKCYI